MLPLVAESVVSTTFLIIAYGAILIVSVLILIALFGPGLGYKVSAGIACSIDSDEFLHMLEALVDAKVNQHTRLTVFTNGEQFYEEELNAIVAAKHSINLEAYIFHEGEIAARFVSQLTKQARKGVKVNLVLDAMGNARTPESFFTELEAAGGRVSWYNSSKWSKLPRSITEPTASCLLSMDRLVISGALVLRTSGGRETKASLHGATPWCEWKVMPWCICRLRLQRTGSKAAARC